MIYKQLIIRVKFEDAIELQKHLFKLGYYWYESKYYIKDKQLKEFKDVTHDGYMYIGVGKSCDIFYISNFQAVSQMATDFNKYKITTYEKLIRKQKIKKINESR